MAEAGLILINLETGDAAFVFQFFPDTVSGSDRANWQPQEVTIGVKPLFYANREPRRTDFPELYLDNTETNQSLTGDIKRLRSLMEETANGTPPRLIAGWGDRSEQCVLEELNIEEIFFNDGGDPIRVRIRLGLLQVQGEGESTSVSIGV